LKHDRGTVILCMLLLLPAALTAHSAEAPPQAGQADFLHRQRALQPGEVVKIRVAFDEPAERVEARGFGRSFLFYPGERPEVWEGLLGIDLETRPGSYEVTVTGRRSGRAPIVKRLQLRITPKRFPTRRLTVDEKYVNPPPEVLDRIREESRRVAGLFAAVSPGKIWQRPFVAPVAGPANSSFGKRSILNGQPRSPHTGADFDVAAGTPVKAPNRARVVLAGELYYSGNTVILDHGLGLYSYLAHLSRIDVEEGNSVEAGDVVGRVGATGRVTGPHLHWTVRLAGTRVDPVSLLWLLGQ